MNDKEKIEKLEKDLDTAHRILANVRNKLQPLATYMGGLNVLELVDEDFVVARCSVGSHSMELMAKDIEILIDAASDEQKFLENHQDNTWGRN